MEGIKMKKLFQIITLASIAASFAGCAKLDNVNPNSPAEVPSNMIMNGAQKWTVDNIYDNWFSGRQCLAYSQQWTQRNYTEEDRYQIRESVNNSYFNYLYMGVANFQKIIELNSDKATAAICAAYGANANQIAAAKIMKAWTMCIITDTWGDVPYSEVGQLEKGVLYCKYDKQEDIYKSLIKELTDAAAQIDESEPAFVSGDVIYGGDASKWKKFANSLKCRLAVHLSKVDPSWKTYINEAVASGVFESNDDAAVYKYVDSGSDYCKFYEGFYIDGRNDFTITRPFVDILKGQKDTLNSKTHPWEGVVDPRLYVYTGPNSKGKYQGIPYAAPTGIQDKFRSVSPNWYSAPPIVLQKSYSVPLMTYAELEFILCEAKGFDAAHYKKGVQASIEYWYDLAGKTISKSDVSAYVTAVSAGVNAETCAIQKYIDLFTNGTEAWTEIRRTGYPDQLLRPGEITCVYRGGNITFTALNETKGLIIPRVKYPTNESTLNGANWKDAVSKLTDGTNNYYSRMYWDVRTDPYSHPANK